MTMAESTFRLSTIDRRLLAGLGGHVRRGTPAGDVRGASRIGYPMLW